MLHYFEYKSNEDGCPQGPMYLLVLDLRPLLQLNVTVIRERSVES